MNDLIQLEQKLRYLAQTQERVTPAKMSDIVWRYFPVPYSRQGETPYDVWKVVAKYFDQDEWSVFVSKLYGS